MSHMSSLITETPCSPNSPSSVGADCEPLTFPSQSTLQLLHHPFNSTLTKHFFHPTGISSPEQNKPSHAMSGQPKETRFPRKFGLRAAAPVSGGGLGSRCSVFLSRGCLASLSSISNSPDAHRNCLLTSTSSVIWVKMSTGVGKYWWGVCGTKRGSPGARHRL